MEIKSEENKKRFLISLFGIVFLMIFSFWTLPAQKAEATDYKFLDIYLDTDSTGLCVCCTMLKQFHGINSLPHTNDYSLLGGGSDILNLPANPTPRAGYQCGIWIVEEDLIDQSHILWTKKGKKISKSGTSIAADLGALGTDRDWCTSCTMGGPAGDCKLSKTFPSSTACDGNLTDGSGTDGLITYSYGNMDCQAGAAADIDLSVGGASKTYRPKYDILCAGTNNWKTCESNSCASVNSPNDWACSGATKEWTQCSGGETCNVATGACEAPVVVANQLQLGIVANPSPVLQSSTSIITFTVKKASDGSAVNDSLVQNITITSGGGSLSSNNCSTGAGSNTCTVTFTAPATAGSTTITATAQKAAFTDGGGTITINTVLDQWEVTNCGLPGCPGCTVGTLVSGCGSTPCIDTYVVNAIKSGCSAGIVLENQASGATELCTSSLVQCGSTYYGYCEAGNPPKYCGVKNDCSSVTPKNNSGLCGCPAGQVPDANGVNCTAVAPPPPPPPTPNCASTMCGAANITPCVCGGTTLNGADVWCGSTPTCNPGQGFALQALCQSVCIPAGPICDNNGAQNNGETGVDCGGGGCPACGGGGAVVPPNCSPNSWQYCNPIPPIDTLSKAAETFLGYILGLIGSVALLLIIISGVLYMTSAGSEEKISTSKRILTGAVVGLGIALLAYSLLKVIIDILNA